VKKTEGGTKNAATRAYNKHKTKKQPNMTKQKKKKTPKKKQNKKNGGKEGADFPLVHPPLSPRHGERPEKKTSKTRLGTRKGVFVEAKKRGGGEECKKNKNDKRAGGPLARKEMNQKSPPKPRS